MKAQRIAQVSSVPAGPSRELVFVLATATGLIVANLYYLQPVLGNVASTFQVGESDVGLVATLGQLGYALGLLLIVPQGDARNRRNLIVATLVAEALALVAVALAPGLVWLAPAAFAVGVLTVGGQIIIPLAHSAWGAFGWSGVCSVGAGMVLVALSVWLSKR